MSESVPYTLSVNACYGTSLSRGPLVFCVASCLSGLGGEKLCEFSSHGLPDKWYPTGEAYSPTSPNARELFARGFKGLHPAENFSPYSTWRHQKYKSCRTKRTHRKKAIGCIAASGTERVRQISSRGNATSKLVQVHTSSVKMTNPSGKH